jgi:hypothetical protein
MIVFNSCSAGVSLSLKVLTGYALSFGVDSKASGLKDSPPDGG